MCKSWYWWRHRALIDPGNSALQINTDGSVVGSVFHLYLPSSEERKWGIVAGDPDPFIFYL